MVLVKLSKINKVLKRTTERTRVKMKILNYKETEGIINKSLSQ